MSKRDIVNLADFISTTLTDIAKGVNSANSQLTGSPAQFFLCDTFYAKENHTSVVEFDVGLGAEKQDGGKVGLGVVAGFFGGGIEEKDNEILKNSHRVRFTVAIKDFATREERKKAFAKMGV